MSKKETLVIRVQGDRYNIRLPNGIWHSYRSRTEAAEILFCAGLNAYALLQNPIVEPTAVNVEYGVFGKHKWRANGVPMPLKYVRGMLREAGCNKETISAIVHAEKLHYEIARHCAKQ